MVHISQKSSLSACPNHNTRNASFPIIPGLRGSLMIMPNSTNARMSLVLLILLVKKSRRLKAVIMSIPSYISKFQMTAYWPKYLWYISAPQWISFLFLRISHELTFLLPELPSTDQSCVSVCQAVHLPECLCFQEERHTAAGAVRRMHARPYILYMIY